MNSPIPAEWRPVAVEDIQKELRNFRHWVLCGGYSVDHWARHLTRSHGDIDIGIFRSDVHECLKAIGRDRVFLCSPPGVHTAWPGDEVPEAVHDIWIADEDCRFWILQIMIFDDDGDRISYRRDRRIHWSKQSHAINVAGIRILNPLITMLFKSNKNPLEEKDVADIMTLIQTHAEKSSGA